MSDLRLLAVDVGTTVVRAGVYDLLGRCLASRSRAIDVHQPQPGETDVHATAYYDAVAMVCRRAVRAVPGVDKAIQAIGLCGQMGGVVGVDEAFKPVTRFDPHLDERCQPIREQLLREHEQTLRALTGCVPYMSVKIRWWQDQQPADAAKVRKWVTIGGYVAARMAGLSAEGAFIDRTHLGLTGLVDHAAGTWSETLMSLSGVSPEVLPEIVPCTKVVGHLSSVAAPDFALPPGIPIVAGLGDHAATFLGADVTRPGRLCDLSSLISHFAATTDHFAADNRHRALSTLAGPMEPLWYAMAYVNAGGITCRWLLHDLLNSTAQTGELPARIRAIEEEARAVEAGSEGLLFIPHMMGRQCPWDPAFRGSWIGLQPSHTQKHLYRSIFESVAFEYAYFLLVVREMFDQTRFDEIHGIGPGSRSALWAQIKADVLGVPYVLPGRDDHAMLGAAIVAAVGIQEVPGMIETSEAWTSPGARILPDRQRHREYADILQLYLRALSEIRPILAELHGLARRTQATVPAPEPVTP